MVITTFNMDEHCRCEGNFCFTDFMPAGGHISLKGDNYERIGEYNTEKMKFKNRKTNRVITLLGSYTSNTDFADFSSETALKEWGEKYGFTYISMRGRVFWCPSLASYFRDAIGVHLDEDGSPTELIEECDVEKWKLDASDKEYELLKGVKALKEAKNLAVAVIEKWIKEHQSKEINIFTDKEHERGVVSGFWTDKEPHNDKGFILNGKYIKYKDIWYCG